MPQRRFHEAMLVGWMPDTTSRAQGDRQVVKCIAKSLGHQQHPIAIHWLVVGYQSMHFMFIRLAILLFGMMDSKCLINVSEMVYKPMCGKMVSNQLSTFDVLPSFFYMFLKDFLSD